MAPRAWEGDRGATLGDGKAGGRRPEPEAGEGFEPPTFRL